MKPIYFVINHDECVAVVYQSVKFGIVIVFRASKIDIEYPIEVMDAQSGKKEDDGMLELILEILPK